MACCSGSLTKCNNIGDVRKLIHKEMVSKLVASAIQVSPQGHIDDGKLDHDRFDYLVALQDGFLPICHGASFDVEPYRPHQFSWQFGFC